MRGAKRYLGLTEALDVIINVHNSPALAQVETLGGGGHDREFDLKERSPKPRPYLFSRPPTTYLKLRQLHNGLQNVLAKRCAVELQASEACEHLQAGHWHVWRGNPQR